MYAIIFFDPNLGISWTANLAADSRDEAEAYAKKMCRGQARVGRYVTYKMEA